MLLFLLCVFPKHSLFNVNVAPMASSKYPDNMAVQVNIMLLAKISTAVFLTELHVKIGEIAIQQNLLHYVEILWQFFFLNFVCAVP